MVEDSVDKEDDSEDEVQYVPSYVIAQEGRKRIQALAVHPLGQPNWSELILYNKHLLPHLKGRVEGKS